MKSADFFSFQYMCGNHRDFIKERGVDGIRIGENKQEMRMIFHRRFALPFINGNCIKLEIEQKRQ